MLRRGLISIAIVVPVAEGPEVVHLALAQQLELEEETTDAICWRGWYLLRLWLRIPRFGGFGFGFSHGGRERSIRAEDDECWWTPLALVADVT